MKPRAGYAAAAALMLGWGIPVLVVAEGHLPDSAASATPESVPGAAGPQLECKPDDRVGAEDRTAPSAGGRQGRRLAPGLRAGGRRRLQGCFIAPEAVAEGLEEGRFSIVDVRGDDAASRFRIRASLNIPAHVIKTKSYLRSRPLLLVADGHSVRRLEELCLELPAYGFHDVRIMDGGLNAWRKRIGPLAGDPLAQRQLSLIDPQVYFTERVYDHWLVVQIAGDPIIDRPGIPRVDSGLDREAMAGRLRELASAHAEQTGGPAYLLLIDADGSRFDAVEPAMMASDVVNIFYLKGGLAGYRAFLDRHAAMLSYVPQHDRPGRGCLDARS